MKDGLKRGFVFYIFSAIFFAAQFVSYMVGSPMAENMDGLGWAFYLTAAVSHAAIFAAVPYLLFALTLAATKNEKIAGGVHVFFVTFINALLYVSGNIFALYRQHLNGMMLSLFFGEGGSEIFQFDGSIYARNFAAFAAMLIVNILAKIGTARLFGLRQRFYWVPTLAVFLSTLLFSNATHAYAAVAQRQSVVKSAAYLPYYFPMTATRFMIRIGVVEQGDLLKVDFGQQSELQYPRNQIVANTPDSLPNIIILAIDSWNYRTLNPDVMPNVSRFADSCELFTNHLSSSNGTRGSIFGMFYGASSYYWRDFDVSGTTPVLMDELQNAGYQIKAYASATLNNPNFNKLMFRKVPGIQTETEGDSVYKRDCRITEQFIDFADTVNNDNPFFAFIFYDLAHGMTYPKHLPQKYPTTWDHPDYMRLNNQMDPTPFWNLYLNCVSYVDSLVGMVLDELDKRNLLSNTYLIITGDHGQEFNENHKNYWGHGSNYTGPQIHVPLIVSRPQGRAATYSHRTTHYDISTTLLHDVLGVQNPTSDYSMGLPLADTTFRNWHVVGDNLNYAFIIDQNTIVEKKPSGMLDICDSTLNPLKNFKLNAVELNSAINRLNMFYKQ